MDWLVVSFVASVVLTITLNVALRAFRGSSNGTAQRSRSGADGGGERRRVAGGRNGHDEVFFSWKTALVASLVLTIVLNVVIRLF